MPFYLVEIEFSHANYVNFLKSCWATRVFASLFRLFLHMKCEKCKFSCVLDTSCLLHSTGWTWRAGTPVARRRCPTLGERAARSARTSCSSTAAPTTPAAPRWPRRPTLASATPTPTSTTTMPSASWTAASASCRKWRGSRGAWKHQ